MADAENRRLHTRHLGYPVSGYRPIARPQGPSLQRLTQVILQNNLKSCARPSPKADPARPYDIPPLALRNLNQVFFEHRDRHTVPSKEIRLSPIPVLTRFNDALILIS